MKPRRLSLLPLVPFLLLLSSFGRLGALEIEDILGLKRWDSYTIFEFKRIDVRDTVTKWKVFGGDYDPQKAKKIPVGFLKQMATALSEGDRIHAVQNAPFEPGERFDILVFSKRQRPIFTLSFFEGSDVVRIHQVIQVKKGLVRTSFIDEVLLYLEIDNKRLAGMQSLLSPGSGKK